MSEGPERGGGGTAGALAERRTDSWSTVAGADRVAQAAAKLARLGNSTAETRTRKRYLNLLDLRSGEIVVDVGAGSGVVTAEIARQIGPGGRVFAVDPSAGLLERARQTTRDAGVGHLVDVRTADGADLPFGISAFDAALCHWVLSHVEAPEKVVTEMRRVTRRGGRVMAVEADWETMIVHPGDISVTRRIVANAAARHIDGAIGRKLPGIFAASGFADALVEPIVTVDRGGPERIWLDFLFERAAYAVAAKVVERDEAVRWMAALTEAYERDAFFFAVTEFAVLGRVPG
jgi:ubiquinone/menaquinone biosynthesis C-methylase UbiE